MKKAFAFLFLAFVAIAFAEGPLYHFKDPATQGEFENVYQDLRSTSGRYVQNTNALQSGSTFYVSSGTVSGQLSANTLVATLGANLPAAGFKITGLGAGTTAGDSVRFQQLKVLSIPSVGATTTVFGTTSSSFQTSNTTVTITPSSSSSKILIIACGTLHVAANSHSVFASLFNGSTNLLGSNGQAELLATGSGTWWAPFTLMTVDSPASTSAQTYSVKIKNDDNATTVAVGDTGVQSIIIAIEISGS
jgi:hypothetical protein